GGDESRTKGASRFALTRHGMAIDHGGGRTDRPRHAEKDGGDEGRRRRGRGDAQQQGKGGWSVKVGGGGDQNRQSDHAREPRHAADRQTDHDAENEDHEPRRLQQQLQRMKRHGELVGHRARFPTVRRKPKKFDRFGAGQRGRRYRYRNERVTTLL